MNEYRSSFNEIDIHPSVSNEFAIFLNLHELCSDELFALTNDSTKKWLVTYNECRLPVNMIHIVNSTC